MFVVVAGTTVACFSEMTTWTVEECTTSPFVGLTMLSSAVLLGRGDGADDGVDEAGLAWLEHADRTAATIATTKAMRAKLLRLRPGRGGVIMRLRSAG
jgi:hypothetical protein